ncbi:MAG: archease [Nanohaloarchaea archaeon]|nr:archease [Candidatus Nanohaloarchaea archaeon]
MGYKILGHTADEKFHAEGETVEEAFSESVKAVAEIVGADPGAGENHHNVEIESESYEALFFDFLDKIIFLQDTENQVVTHAENLKVEKIGNIYLLEAKLNTDPIVEGSGFLDLKAPTYNEMKVDYEDGTGWILEAVLDI